jgi:hypothetical protein
VKKTGGVGMWDGSKVYFYRLEKQNLYQKAVTNVG